MFDFYYNHFASVSHVKSKWIYKLSVWFCDNIWYFEHLCGDLTAAYLRWKRQLRCNLVCVSGGLFLSPSRHYFPAVHGSSAMIITKLLLFPPAEQLKREGGREKERYELVRKTHLLDVVSCPHLLVFSKCCANVLGSESRHSSPLKFK